MWLTKRRLERDLKRWREKGWVSAEGEAAIRSEISSSGTGLSLATVLAILGVVLLGFAAMSFVASNWQDIPRLGRLGLLMAGIWGSYGVAGALQLRGMHWFSQAAVLLGVALFGASIMLVAQMYHIDGNPPDAVLTWAGGGLLAGVALNSNPALALTMALVVLWSGWESSIVGAVHFPFLIGWALVSAAFYWRGWRPGFHISAFAMSWWIVSLGHLVDATYAHILVIACGLAVAAASQFVDRVLPRLEPLAPSLMSYGLVIAFAGLFAEQFIARAALGELIFWAIATLALVLGAIYLGVHRGDRRLAWLGYIGFSIETLALYFKTVGTLMGSSLFFLSAGLIVIALSALAWRLHVRSLAIEEGRP